MPSLREGWRLADELGLPPLSPRPLTPLVLVAETEGEMAGWHHRLDGRESE